MEDVVILVGGQGKRLGNLTKNFPKPLLEINNIPFLTLLMNDISRYGFKNFFLLAGHASESLKYYFDNNKFDYNVQIIIENEVLGTGGSIINALPKLSDKFFCFNGDSFLKGNWLNIKRLFDNNTDAVIALKEVKDPGRFGSVICDLDGTIENFSEKSSKSKIINAGIYLFNKKVFSKYKIGNISLEKDIFPRLVKQKKLKGKLIDGKFIDIGIEETLRIARKERFFNYKNAVVLDRDGTINLDDGYTYKSSDLVFNEHIKDFIVYLNDKNILVIVATNQSGIARGFFDESEMHTFHKEMQKQLHDSSAHIDKFYFCPFHKDGKLKKYKKDSKLRKPNIGMLEKIQSDWFLEKDNMLMIGDSNTDIECANNFGIKSLKYDQSLNLNKLINFVDTHLKI